VPTGARHRRATQEDCPQAKDFTNRRAYRNASLTEADGETNRRKSSIRSKVEHPFLTLKRLWGFTKTRYHGLAKKLDTGARAVLSVAEIVGH